MPSCIKVRFVIPGIAKSYDQVKFGDTNRAEGYGSEVGMYTIDEVYL